jgi:hypothetical protein
MAKVEILKRVIERARKNGYNADEILGILEVFGDEEDLSITTYKDILCSNEFIQKFWVQQNDWDIFAKIVRGYDDPLKLYKAYI